MGEAPGQGLVRSRDRMKDMRTMASSRVLLTTLSVRISAKGRQYLAGWLGKASVVAFAGEPDKWGNETWDVFLAQPEPRDGPPVRERSPSGDDAHAGRTSAPAEARARPGDFHRAPRREGAAARRERVAGEVARDYGGGELDDAIPF